MRICTDLPEPLLLDSVVSNKVSCAISSEFSYFSTKTYVVGTQKNCLNERLKQIFKPMDKKI